MFRFNILKGISRRCESTISFGKKDATGTILSNVIKPSALGSKRTDRKSNEKNEIVKKYVLHCNFTKNNTHFTYCAVMEDLNFLQNNAQLSYNDKLLYYMKLPSKVRLKLSTGCLGFRKAARGEYEAGFQTANKIFQMIQEKNVLNKDIEIVMKDFGKGRAAFIAALNGKEGTAIRKYVKSVSDATPLKFGGVRSPRIRRL
ncbi:similar to Saccharomyces cerevisiae YNL306W MRPS18 Mitochondrial ribosomal protein of the small subunit [Maudiozyma barnettii]|uniref:Small ribosomal subunit protein uS11m n=1 Tax=Maudiozyma barnettii TaxID=61262 RepID=A0A8H2VEF0_9SACH|nr:mitochondrial 37S ribosomal protein YmS18 [Kazachstania barnettii]CAB4253534.1 similar to Saccharomyces cerevisiae YNL306W MRPS18 Mitochondrial ribosomal protein of the small subunit [Kazachstania barnettii]CAD1781208.1 similar to Saccharomyces cerevisiae YNL306W MRPS18 Mitochondrial ribosomal protein of the small subunit [Kazachstania barnettii]